MKDLLQELTKKYHLELSVIEQSGSFAVIAGKSEEIQAGIGAIYFLAQLEQGGFIQFYHNGYAFLLLPLIQFLQRKNQLDIVDILDKSLQYYVENKAEIDAPEDAKSFAQLYTRHPFLDELEVQLKPLQHIILNTLING